MQPLWLAKPQPDQKRLSQLSDQVTGDHERSASKAAMADLKHQCARRTVARREE
jgi:hypothetical protein